MKVTAEAIRSLVPFARTLDVEFTELSPDKVVAQLANRPELATMGGGLHGGAIMGLSDLAGAVCTALNIGDSDAWTTVESTTYFMRPVRGEVAVANATATRKGKSLIFVEIDIFSEDELVARTTQVLAVQRHVESTR